MINEQGSGMTMGLDIKPVNMEEGEAKAFKKQL